MAVNTVNYAVLATTVLLSAFLTNAGDFDGWSEGRATFYGEDGGTTIYEGSCMMDIGSLSTGKDIAALSDANHDYKGSCARCYEVACRPSKVKDGYGNELDRTGTCQGQKSVIVTITDTCPCYYPSNQFSNTRWCCGDQYHMDLSVYAFEKIANKGDGVMGIYYREVECPGGQEAHVPCDHNDACERTDSWAKSSSSSNSDGNSQSSLHSESWSSSSGDGGSSSSSSSSSGDGWSSSTSSSWSSTGGKRKLLLQ